MGFVNSPVFNRVIVPVSFFSSVAGGLFLLREFRGGKQCPNKDEMHNKIVVITGGNSGIGKATAKGIAKRGATVVLGCRHMGKCERVAQEIRKEVENLHVVCRFVDLANFDSITKFAATLHKELSHIDVLINNAGVMKPRTPKTTLLTDDGFERQFGVNHLGHFLLTNLLIDKLISGTEPGRVINVTAESSIKHGKIDIDDIKKSTLEGDEQLSQLYYQSKLANIYFTESLSRKYEGKLTSNCLNPGVVKTNINRYSSTPLLSPLWIFEPLKFPMLKTPRQGAQTSLHLASDPNKTHTTGRYFDDCEEVSKTCDICDEELAKLLWTKSEEWTNLSERYQSMKKLLNSENTATISSKADR